MRNRRGAGGKDGGRRGTAVTAAERGVPVLGRAAAAPSPLPAAPPVSAGWGGSSAAAWWGGVCSAGAASQRPPPRSGLSSLARRLPLPVLFSFICDFARLAASRALGSPAQGREELWPPACALPRLHLTGGAARQSRSCAPGGSLFPAPAAGANGGAAPCPGPRGGPSSAFLGRFSPLLFRVWCGFVLF